MKRFIIASLLACFIGGPALLHGDKANRLAIRDELQQLVMKNENFVALQEIEAKSQKGWALVAKLGAHCSSLGALNSALIAVAVIAFEIFLYRNEHDENRLRFLMPTPSANQAFYEAAGFKKSPQYHLLILSAITIITLAASYGFHALADHVIAPITFKNKLKTFFETWNKTSTFYNFKSKLTETLRPIIEKHYATWAKLKDESKEKADAYLHDLSCELRACARSFKKTGYWNSLVGKQTIIEGVILVAACIIFGIYKVKRKKTVNP